MSKNWNKDMWKGMGWGALAGLLLAFAIYLYWQVTDPHLYKFILLIYGFLLLPIFGAMVGMLVAAMQE